MGGAQVGLVMRVWAAAVAAVTAGMARQPTQMLHGVALMIGQSDCQHLPMPAGPNFSLGKPTGGC